MTLNSEFSLCGLICPPVNACARGSAHSNLLTAHCSVLEIYHPVLKLATYYKLLLWRTACQDVGIFECEETTPMIDSDCDGGNLTEILEASHAAYPTIMSTFHGV